MIINIEKQENGFLAKCPEIQGAFAEGDNEFEAFYNLVDVINMIAEYKKTTFNITKQKLHFDMPFQIA